MPVDRMRMRPWLEQQITSGEIQGLLWVDKDKRIFQIPWMHAARHGWDLEKDAPLFKNWAIHTGKYRPDIDKPDPKTWKANFRCAMNSLPDIEEVKDLSMKKGSNAFRMYRMLSSSEKAAKKGKKKMDLEQRAKGFQKRKAGTPRKIKNLKGQFEAELERKIETSPDSTVLFAEQESSSELHDVCAVVEVGTENEEPGVCPVEVSLPLQDSHVSGSSHESDTESTYSDEDLVQDLSIKARTSCSSVLRIPPSNSSPNTFFTSEKTNFRVTSCREDSPLIAYNTPPWFPCPFNFQTVTDVRPSSPAQKADLTSSPTSQASVMANAVDLSVAKNKTLQ
ncbi:interferon regulatory factor 2a isoform X2 [Pimephales promelas]|uniref:interferon regulatory factor 2a isoform X2 n=1 Tax=Pimephales promelas TaxID=90988 RepID=UPI001955E16E|nr:interferon regulatory factor 2a isoform X2 [Pimephales promelas]KAG1956509.1 interferon regulatory factor [Pimephales promelas]